MSRNDPITGGIDPTGLTGTVQVQKVSMSQMQRDRIVAAYKQNIVLPEVSVVSRNDTDEPDSIGSDGATMDLNRRAELMQGKPPALVRDETGRVHEAQVNYIELRADDPYKDEDHGASSIARRKPMRVIQPVELGTVGSHGPICLWSSTQDMIATKDDLYHYLDAALDAIESLEVGSEVVTLEASAEGDAVAAVLYGLPWGQSFAEALNLEWDPVPEHRNQIRLVTSNGNYASLFLHRDLSRSWAH